MTLVIDPKVALLKGVDPVQFCVFIILAGDGCVSQTGPGRKPASPSSTHRRPRSDCIYAKGAVTVEPGQLS